MADQKPRWDLLPWRGTEAVVRVLTSTEDAKYPNNHYLTVPVRTHLAAAIRHVVQHFRGVEADHETGEPPLAHAAARLLFALDLVERRVECMREARA